MSKKSIAFLVCAIIFFVLALGIFIYAQTISSEPETETEATVDPSETTKPSGFVFYNSDGDEISISSFSGTPIALILWSSNTDNSYEILQMINEIYSEYKTEVTFLVVNTEEPDEDIIETVENCDFSFSVYYDLDNLASEYYSYSKLPTLIFLESDGTKSNQIEGEIEEDSLLANLDIIAGNY